MTNGSLMKVKSIAECSKGSILQYFWPALSDNWSWKPVFGVFKSGHFTQVLLYTLLSVKFSPHILYNIQDTVKRKFIFAACVNYQGPIQPDFLAIRLHFVLNNIQISLGLENEFDLCACISKCLSENEYFDVFACKLTFFLSMLIFLRNH